MRSAFLFLILLLIYGVSRGQNTPKYSNEFLAIGVGARALGMANSVTAITDDATSGYWNPAGLLNIKEKYAVSAMHAAYFAGIANYDFAGFATPIDRRSAIGISLIRFAVDDIPDTRFLFDADGRLNYDNIRSFSAADYALIFSYARHSPLIQGLQLGANFKVIHRTVGIFANAWGFGIDLGAQLRRGNWSFGATLRDVTGTYNAWNYNPETFFDVFAQTGNTIPENSIEVTMPRLLLGAGHRFEWKEKAGVLVTAGADVTFDGRRNTLVKTDLFSVDPYAGVEFDYLQTFFLRGGLGAFQEIKNFNGTTNYTFQPNFGLGVQIKKIMVDYALTDIGDRAAALYSHVISIRVHIGKSKFSTPRFTPDNE
jgi:hypothetical protein